MSKFINYIPLLILLIFYSCQTNINKEYTEIGGLSILEFPESQELQKWIESDSQYKQVFQVRRYFEDFVSDGFFEKNENQLEFNSLTWSKMVEYQKRYSDLLLSLIHI